MNSGECSLSQSERRSIEVEVISGACMMMKRKTFAKLGGFSTDYFMCSEDVDLCFFAWPGRDSTIISWALQG